MSVLEAALLGLFLGAVMGMPIGVVNAAVVEAALADRARFAIGLGLGGALADATHATVAFAGITHLDPAWTTPLTVVAIAWVIVYALITWRRRKRGAPRRWAIPSGLMLTLPNPASLTAWIGIAALLPRQPEPFVVGGGVLLGSAVWFTVLAKFVAKHREHRLVRSLPFVSLVVLVAVVATIAVRAGCS